MNLVSALLIVVGFTSCSYRFFSKGERFHAWFMLFWAALGFCLFYSNNLFLIIAVPALLKGLVDKKKPTQKKVENIVHLNSSLNKTSTKDSTPKSKLISGIFTNDIELVKKAIKEGVDVNDDILGNQPIVIASYSSGREIIDELYRSGAMVSDEAIRGIWIYGKARKEKAVIEFARNLGFTPNLFEFITAILVRYKKHL